MAFKRCLIVDTETTGIDPKTEKVIEIGAVLYSITNATTIAQASLLLPASGNPARSINQISEEVLAEVEPLSSIYENAGFLVGEMAEEADVFVAHKASFDSAFLTAMNPVAWSARPWLCSKEDFLFEKGKQGDSLINTALAHGVGVFSAHRALTDCQLLARIFDTYGPERLQALFRHAALPRSIYVAVTSYAEKDKPKAAGFSWDSDKKYWHKRLTDSEAAAITDFKIRRLPSEAV